jgi:ElaA protein
MFDKNIVWKCKAFAELSSHELYAIIRLRNEVFVVEQNCVFQDADNKDQQSFHLMGWSDTHLAAYARIVPKGIAYPYISIGRVVSSPANRTSGTGKALMKQAIDYCTRMFGMQPIKIGAQLYLKKFYGDFGFSQTGEEYDEDGIPHIEMIKEAKFF